MKSIITGIAGIALSASLLLPVVAPINALAESLADKAPAGKATTADTQTVLVHPRLKGAEGAGWVRAKVTQTLPVGMCLRPLRTSLKGAEGTYAPGQKLMRCATAAQCGAPQCPGHVTCVSSS